MPKCSRNLAVITKIEQLHEKEIAKLKKLLAAKEEVKKPEVLIDKKF